MQRGTPGASGWLRVCPRWFFWAPPMTPLPPATRGGAGRAWAAPGEPDAFVKDLEASPGPFTHSAHPSPPQRWPGAWHQLALHCCYHPFILFFCSGVMTHRPLTPRFLRFLEWPPRVESRPPPSYRCQELGIAHSPRAQPQTATPGPALPVLWVGALSGQLALQVSEGPRMARGPLGSEGLNSPVPRGASCLLP